MGRTAAKRGSRLKWPELRARLAKQRPEGIFAFCGPELLLKREALAAMAGALLGKDAQPESERYILDRHRAGESGFTEIASAAAQTGLFGSERIVIVEEAERLSRVRGKREQEQWLELAQSAPPNPLVFCSTLTSRELAQKAAFLDLVLRPMTVVDFWHLFPRDAARWIVDFAREKGLHCTAEAAAAIVSHLGTDLFILASEVEKLALLRPGERLGLNELRELASRGLLGSSWECVDAALEGRLTDAIGLLRGVMHEESASSFAWKLSRSATMRLLGQDRSMRSPGWGSGGAASGTQVARTGISAAREKLLGRLLGQCYLWDRNLKRGSWIGSKDCDFIGLEMIMVDHACRSRGAQRSGGVVREP